MSTTFRGAPQWRTLVLAGSYEEFKEWKRRNMSINAVYLDADELMDEARGAGLLIVLTTGWMRRSSYYERIIERLISEGAVVEVDNHRAKDPTGALLLPQAPPEPEAEPSEPRVKRLVIVDE